MGYFIRFTARREKEGEKATARLEYGGEYGSTINEKLRDRSIR